MSDTTYIGAGIVTGLKQTVSALDKALAEENGELTAREQTQTLLAIAEGVLLTLDNHNNCPALRFYLGFVKWIWPILFGLILIGILGGAAAFRELGLAIPSP